MRKISSFFKIMLISTLIIVALILILAFHKTNNEKETKPLPNGVNVLLLMAKNYGLNYFRNLDIFEQYGWNITYVGVSESITACPPVAEQFGVPPITPDILLSDISDISEYDGLLLMPASGNYLEVPHSFGDLLDSPKALKLISKAVEKGLAVYATCAGVRVLAAADVINGKKVGGSPKFQTEYNAAGATFVGLDHPPVIEGSVITSARGLYYSFPNCQAIATVIENNQDSTLPKKTPKEKFIFSSPAEFAKDDVVWAKTYGGSSSDGGRALCETADGGYFIVGYTFSHGSDDADILAIKTDASGNEVWSKTFGGSGTEYGYGCIAVNDGYIIVGYTTSFGAGSKDIYIIKINSKGNELWSKTYGGSSWDVGTAVCETGDNGYIVCGFTHSFGAGEEDVYVIKIDANGNEIWSKIYGGNRYEIGNSVYSAKDSGFVIGATTGTYGDGKNCNYYLIKIDANGNELWTKSYGNKGRRGYGYDWCSSMNMGSDGSYILSGETDCNDVQDAYVLKTDAEGNEIWSKIFGKKPFHEYGNSICPTKDSGFIMCGTNKTIDGNNNVYLAKIDAKGNIVWEKTIGGPASDWGSSVSVTKDGDYIVLGYTNSSGKGYFDVLLIKIHHP